MLLLLFRSPATTPASPEFIDLSAALADLYPQLGATGAADLTFWTTDELYQFMDEAAQKLSRSAGVWCVRDTSVVSVLGQGPYSLPSNQVATVQADLGGFVLRPANVQEIEALDAQWPSTQGSPLRFLQDTPLGVHDLVLYPAPDSGAAGQRIGLVMHVWPATVSASNPTIAAPTVLREYFTFSALAGARSKETKAAMPEVAEWFGQLAGLYESTIDGYWGGAM